ncbi:MAG: nucleoside triphosphate pyrophosphohydrolase [Patescibacteria group bacterium]
MKYNKLVRDKIPDIIKTKGGTPKTHCATNEEYLSKLEDKLREEMEEFLKDKNPEELADILEVIKAFANLQNLTLADIEKIRERKAKERGGFEKRIILDES